MIHHHEIHCMLDLETLGTTPGSVIVSIGACLVSRSGIIAEFYCPIDAQSAVEIGLTIDAPTVLWWLAQSDDARAELTNAASQVPIRQALQEFRDWLPSHIPIWGNGSDFDNVLLAAAYHAAGETEPWSHRQNRCYRTLRALHPKIEAYPLGATRTRHHALDDARYQATHLHQILSA